MELAIGLPDNEILVRLYESVSREYFQDALSATIEWGVPKGSVLVKSARASYQLVKGEVDQFEMAKSLRGEDAITLLVPLAEKGHLESEFLLSHLLPANDGRKLKYSKAYNKSFSGQTAVSAACYYPDDNKIVIHSYLHQKNAPQYVIKYLIYHECCHQLVPSDLDNPHPPEFMDLERKVKHRERSMDWLEKEGFPTMRLAEV